MARGLQSLTQGVKVAIFVIALVAAGFLVFRMVSKTSNSGGSYTVYTHLKDATGLVPKSRIKIAGIGIGYIESITLDGGEARVALKVDKGVVLHDNATAAKRLSSLLGEQVLVITPGTPEYTPIPDQGWIKNVAEGASTDKIMEDLAAIAENVKKVSKQAAGAFGTDEGGQQMKDILKNLAEVSKEINSTVKDNRKSVTETIKSIENITIKSAPRVDAILANVQSVTGDFKDLLEADRSKLNPQGDTGAKAIRETVDHVRDASSKLESTLKHADNVIARIDAGEGTLGRLTTDKTLITDVEGIASDIHDFTSGIGRTQIIVGLRGEYFIKSNGVKSTVEIRLQPREDKYYLVEIVNDPRGKTTITQVDVNSTNPNNVPFYRETRTETTNGFRFTFMFARRLGPATFLFGIRESSGGVGLNLHAFDDRLELQSDLFGFGENVRPRWRERFQYEFVKRIWVVAGVDDLLNGDRTDYFVGAQLRFTDEDLKAILPFASIKP
jgi:phospholipid/cholesterol/gamma-HCH transport system substrate-binding protein